MSFPVLERPYTELQVLIEEAGELDKKQDKLLNKDQTDCRPVFQPGKIHLVEGNNFIKDWAGLEFGGIFERFDQGRTWENVSPHGKILS